MNSDRGEGVQNPENLADVIYVRPLILYKYNLLDQIHMNLETFHINLERSHMI